MIVMEEYMLVFRLFHLCTYRFLILQSLRNICHPCSAKLIPLLLILFFDRLKHPAKVC